MTTTTHPRFELPGATGRTLNANELLRQIGVNLLAVSGGRWRRHSASSVGLPCGAGFEVLVTLEADDTYTVRRLFWRSARIYLHGELANVYCDDVSEVVYYASCFRSYDADEWQHQG